MNNDDEYEKTEPAPAVARGLDVSIAVRGDDMSLQSRLVDVYPRAVVRVASATVCISILFL